MRKILKSIIIIGISTLLGTFSWAKLAKNPYFDLQASNKQLELLSQKVKTHRIKALRLELHINALEQLHATTESCIDNVKEKLSTINKILSDDGGIFDIKSAEYRYFLNQKVQYKHFLSQCRYFDYRANEVLIAAKDKLNQLTTSELLNKSPPLWEAIAHWSAFKLEDVSLIKLTGIDTIEPHKFFLALMVVVIGFICSKVLLNRLFKSISFKKASPFHKKILHAAKMLLPYLITAGLTSLVLFIYFYQQKSPPMIAYMVYAVFFYLLLISVLFLFFFQEKNKQRFNPFKIPAYFNRIIYHRLLIISSYILFGFFVFYLFKNLDVSSSHEEIFRSAYIIILSIIMFWTIWPVISLPYLQKKPLLSNAIKLIFSLLLIMTIFLEFIGYHQLVIYFVFNFVLSVGLFLVTWVIITLVEQFYLDFSSKKSLFSKKAHHLLGVKPHRQLIEASLLKWSIYLLTLAIAVICLLKIWKFSAIYIDALEHSLVEGFNFSGIYFIPARIVLGLVVFSVLNMVGRLIATRVTNTHHFEKENDTQVAIASIISYLGFSLALIAALVISGFNFTGLAIIVGALSVGIGLGLQNIVNNFISGIILLLEKPIKPGDRITVGETEGFVNKIRVRSTQIRTLAREDVIVPNSDLITNQVTNYMFRDQYWRVICKVGVAYGSDTDLVRKVLLEVAKANPSVLKEPPNAPSVMFRAFGDSTLDFELWSIIKDVNKKNQIASDLNFAIDQAFRAHNITIAFPQREVYIKNNNNDNKS